MVNPCTVYFLRQTFTDVNKIEDIAIASLKSVDLYADLNFKNGWRQQHWNKII